MEQPKSTNGNIETRSVKSVDSETKSVSSDVLDIISLKGKTTDVGPGTGSCDINGESTEGTFMVRHPWSISGSTVLELEDAMQRLHINLPQHGWKVSRYGNNTSKNASLELTADHEEKKFSLNIVLIENSGNSSQLPILAVTVVSDCYKIPEGEELEHY
ncbi:hypothetical protein [Streptomyces oceani]|uniref:hypothetical protein n=1 Tax=Streptomyces oceani TaxID=1075402 RepID=UPI001112E0C7|nr:hypothetical protein [Streptomyces oceani]